MCLSPEASFLASAGPSGAGVASAAVTTHRGKILAAIPFLFAFQQAAEGSQWIARANGIVNTAAAYTMHSVTFVSVWCFFAALLSSLIFLYIWKYENRRKSLQKIQ